MNWIVGSGNMAAAYVKILQAMNVDFKVIGRGEVSAEALSQQTNVKPVTGGLESFLKSKPQLPDSVIVAVPVNQLAGITSLLINYGVQKILVEKPGALSLQELQQVNQEAETADAAVFIAYNRRFFASVAKAKEMIAEDGGLTSFTFEFTEWSHKIEPLKKAPGVKEKWFLANSTHVADLAFFIGGFPEKIACQVAGSLSWHPSASVFSGSGKTDAGALFAYHADWTAAGRWACEFLTPKKRYILKPLEELKIQKTGTIAIEDVTIDDALDKEFKPGLYKQVEDFLKESPELLPSIDHQVRMTEIYYQMANYQ